VTEADKFSQESKRGRGKNSMSEIAIRLENLGKLYRVGRPQENYQNLREALTKAVTSPVRRLLQLSKPKGESARSDKFWALRDVSFEVKRGETVGIIGRNGAGKSTLLKILSRITEPSVGNGEINGRIGSLLEVGTGFHPELTGRENIYLNGAILGMRRAEIASKFDEIVDFAEVDKFVDTPVKHYSSGMYLRLAFSVAAHLEPEILLVDEVLAVGDAAFQKKCLGKMQNVADNGRTVLFVSHNMAAVQALCRRGISLSEGRIACDATADEAVRSYVSGFTSGATRPLTSRTDRKGSGELRFTACWIENKQGMKVDKAMVGEDIHFCFAYKARKASRNVYVAFNLQEQIGDAIVNCNTTDVGQDLVLVPEEGVFVCEIKKFPLRAGRYVGNLDCRVQGVLADWIQGALIVDIATGDYYGTGKLNSQSKVYLPQAWNVRDISRASIISAENSCCCEGAGPHF
jgi:lipopolysaccharide transport system ATP-binding protein